MTMTVEENAGNLEKLMANSVWYDANLNSLLPKNRGRYIAIDDGKVLGDYDDFDKGVDETALAGHALGTFMVHLCVPREEETPWICLSGRAERNSYFVFPQREAHRIDL